MLLTLHMITKGFCNSQLYLLISSTQVHIMPSSLLSTKVPRPRAANHDLRGRFGPVLLLGERGGVGPAANMCSHGSSPELTPQLPTPLPATGAALPTRAVPLAAKLT